MKAIYHPSKERPVHNLLFVIPTLTGMPKNGETCFGRTLRGR